MHFSTERKRKKKYWKGDCREKRTWNISTH